MLTGLHFFPNSPHISYPQNEQTWPTNFRYSDFINIINTTFIYLFLVYLTKLSIIQSIQRQIQNYMTCTKESVLNSTVCLYILWKEHDKLLHICDMSHLKRDLLYFRVCTAFVDLELKKHRHHSMLFDCNTSYQYVYYYFKTRISGRTNFSHSRNSGATSYEVVRQFFCST